MEAQVSRTVQGRNYDVVVIGAGLRTLPAMAEQFERLMNVVRHVLNSHSTRG
jgi:succinate dehydrogenase/fumarate reductase flavoprotein subunit